MTLSMHKEDINLIEIMIAIVSIDASVDIGISFGYDQHQLISVEHMEECKCLEGVNSSFVLFVQKIRSK